MRKKVDERIRTLIENGVRNRHRSMFVIIGDKSRDQIVNLHYMLSKAVVKTRPTVLWCYKDKLELSSHKKKRKKQMKKMMQQGVLDPEKADHFDLLLKLEDFRALTPNLLARTIETVEGGGLIVLLLRHLSSLSSLFTMVMDVHSRFRTESIHRLLVALMSDLYSLLHHRISSRKGTKEFKEQLNEDFPVGPLIRKCCTLDQITGLTGDNDLILGGLKHCCSSCCCVAGEVSCSWVGNCRGCCCRVFQYFVTAPSPENLKTLFDCLQGQYAREYKEHLGYDIVKSNNRSLKATYEGTGRSLSLKLLQPSEEQSQKSKCRYGALSGLLILNHALGNARSSCDFRILGEVSRLDVCKRWLNALLCLDVTNGIPSIRRLPQPGDCDLYYVNRDTLFSYHKDSELFLQRMMALYVASHYKNSPNDLQLMADAPAHHLFVLLGPVDESENVLPDILCVIQVCLEGQISQESAKRALSQGRQPFGDQIPWKFSQQFADDVFPSLSGARIHSRIAAHPSAMKIQTSGQSASPYSHYSHSYGSAAVELLTRYFEGQFTQLSEVERRDSVETPQVNVAEAAEEVSLLEENIRPRTDLPPLLVPLRERRPEKLHYLGVSFGLTLDLFRFWRKLLSLLHFHKCPALKNDDVEAAGSDEWGFYGPFYREYKGRLVELLGSTYQKMNHKLAMSVFDPKINFVEQDPASSASSELLNSKKFVLEPHEMTRLEAYSNSLIDYPLIRDVAQKLAREYFLEHIPVSLSYVQASLLLCYGLQHKDIPEIEGEMALDRPQILALFMKVMKRLYKYLHNLKSKEFESNVSRLKVIKLEPHPISVDEDLNDAAKKVQDEMKAKTAEGLLDPELFQQFAIVDREADFENALQNGGGKISSSGVVSIKSNKSKLEKRSKPETENSDKKRNKSNSGSKSHKKRKG
ncbi:hypothetical protein HAX54_033523 [Datura stramonium]|uniref:RNA cytidine acetyltransferase n=1 Tax=Datura stramonium TaxID=4076 RepID=A0ABS8RMD5_DATST|nr:hypothetical protein [Datura stramonium]